MLDDLALSHKGCNPCRGRTARAQTRAVVLSVALALPLAAWPASLSHLLSLPFEQLLQLQITGPASALPLRSDAASRPTPGPRSAA